MRKIVVDCPECTTPSEYEEPVSAIVFPNQLEAFFDLIEYRLNARTCPVCEKNIILFGDLIILYNEKMKCVSVAINEEVLKTIVEGLKGYSIEFVQDYDGARKEVIKWLAFDLSQLTEGLQEIINSKKDVSETDVISSYQLRLLLSGVRGYVPMKIIVQNENEQPPPLEDFYRKTIKSLLIKIMEECAENNDLLELLNSVKKRIQAECLTDEVLQELCDSCSDVDPNKDDWVTISGKWLGDYLNATVHKIAKKKNPRSINFTHLIMLFWQIKLSSAEFKDTTLLLNKDTIDGLVSFENMFDALVPYLNQVKEAYQDEIKKYEIVMKFYGWGERFSLALLQKQTIKISVDASEENIDTFIRSIIGTMVFSPDGKEFKGNATFVKIALGMLLRSGRTDVAWKCCETILDKAEKNNDLISCIAICIESIKVFNTSLLTEFSSELINIIYDKYEDALLKESPGELVFEFFVETGNTLRYCGQLKDAFDSYQDAKNLLEKFNIYQGDKLSEATDLIKRNMAIIDRDRGKRMESLKTFIELKEKYPNDFGIAGNIATLYLDLSMGEMALNYLLPFENDNSLTIGNNFICNLMIARAYVVDNKDTKAIPYLINIFKNWENYSPSLKAQFINVVLQIDSARLLEEGFAENAEDNLEDILQDDALPRNLFFSSTLFLVWRYLRLKQTEKARKLYERYGINDFISNSWELYYITGWYHFETGDHGKAALQIKRLINCFNENIPRDENIDFAISWMKNKEEIQNHLVEVAFDLYAMGLLSEYDFLDVLDFCNGKDLTARLQKNKAFPSQEEIWKELCQTNPNSEFLMFFKIRSQLHLVHLSTTTKSIFISGEIYGLEDVIQLKAKTINAYKYACPANLIYTDNDLVDFFEFTLQIGKVLSTMFSGQTKSLYIIPGKELSNLPLHLILLPDGRNLIELLPVLYINSISTLALLETVKTDSKNICIVSVTKEQEKEEYFNSIIRFTTTLLDNFHKASITTTLLSQKNATISAVSGKLEETDEMILICHGASGNEGQGKGICLSYDEKLPPELLAINKSKYLKKFLLTWKDIMNVNKTPRLIVSSACSSGTTQIGKGGVQLGLEQALFVKGTTAIISPLWDLEQTAALFWVQCFYEIRMHVQGLNLGECYRLACLKTKEKYNHHYFWSPFILKGSNNQ